MDSKALFGGVDYTPFLCGEESFGTGAGAGPDPTCSRAAAGRMAGRPAAWPADKESGLGFFNVSVTF